MPSYLKELNPVQQEAVKAVNGPVMIVAGAGSGKTRVLTYRVAHLVHCGVKPYEILALTFTNKAANEMKQRIIGLVGKGSQQVWMGTFHSILARILRWECEPIGFGRNFTIYDTDDSLRLIKSAMGDLGISAQQYNPQAIRSKISMAKNQMTYPQKMVKEARDVFEEKTAQIYEYYQTKLLRNNAMDFDDLLLKPIELFQKNPTVLMKYQNRFKFVLVDEYQDTNRAQYILINLLAKRHQNICVVGDDAQSIYAFRGAEIRNILDFRNDYPQCQLFRLEQNYRSTKKILAAADSVIKNNSHQIQKNLWTSNQEGEPVTLIECDDDIDEGYCVVSHIQDQCIKSKLQLKDCAILYRTNSQSRSLEDALRRSGIPYTIVGGTEFYKRKEIKDVLAYLKIIVNPKDDTSVTRVLNYPARGIGNLSILRLRTFASKHKISLFDVLSRVDAVDGLVGKSKAGIKDFHQMIRKYIELKLTISASELVRAIVDEIGILNEFKMEGTPEALARRENVQELLSAITEYMSENQEGTLDSFLEEVSLIADIDTWDDKRNAVTLMTLHSAKGLEFPVVFITGLEEGLFPVSQSTEDKNELEEERRLFYVGITRTMSKLFLTYACKRYRFGDVTYPTSSRFLDEVDQSTIEYEIGRRRRKDKFGLGAGTVAKDSHQMRSLRKKKVAPEYAADSLNGDDYTQGEETLDIGSLVEHETFGRGKVIDLSGYGDSAKAIVQFEGNNRKHLMLKFARLRLVPE
jgi:DNA helicase-2/ATP-dependent DNA helicase PcrA